MVSEVSAADTSVGINRHSSASMRLIMPLGRLSQSKRLHTGYGGAGIFQCWVQRAINPVRLFVEFCLSRVGFDRLGLPDGHAADLLNAAVRSGAGERQQCGAVSRPFLRCERDHLLVEDP